MFLTKRKKQIIKKLSTAVTTAFMIVIQANQVFAEGGIGTAEVQTATENIKRVITSIAMPLRRSSYFCKYSCCSNKNDSKCK